MTDEQFNKMHAVELAKLATLQGIMNTLLAIAAKQGAQPVLYNWKDIEKMLASAAAIAAKPQSP